MKRGLIILMLLMVAVTVGFISNAQAAYNYGDYRSATLISKAWEAFKTDDMDGVLAFTNKCIELYGKKAKEMQDSMTDYAKGTNDEIFKYWALNDVATGYFIQGEAYRRNNKLDEAKKAYQTVVSDYSFGQCWDVGGWFWKPAEAAKEKIAMIESGSTLDFGDYKSSTLTTKAWEALSKKDLDGVLAYTNKCLELYEAEAKKKCRPR